MPRPPAPGSSRRSRSIGGARSPEADFAGVIRAARRGHAMREDQVDCAETRSWINPIKVKNDGGTTVQRQREMPSQARKTAPKRRVLPLIADRCPYGRNGLRVGGRSGSRTGGRTLVVTVTVVVVLVVGA